MKLAMASRAGMGLLAGVLAFGSVGCRTEPGRIPNDVTTSDERENPRQIPITFDEFESAAVADLLQKLPTMPGVSEKPGKMTVLLGDINNMTGLTSTADYEFVMAGIRSRLIAANATRNKLGFVEARRRVENLAARERVATAPAPPQASGEEIKWGGGSYYVPDYNAAMSLGLYLDVYRVGRGNTNQYRMVLQVVELDTNNIVYSFIRTTKQVSGR